MYCIWDTETKSLLADSFSKSGSVITFSAPQLPQLREKLYQLNEEAGRARFLAVRLTFIDM